MTLEEKSELLKSLIITKTLGSFLDKKRNEGELMDEMNSYNLLFKALTEDDIISLNELNIKFAIITAPAAQFTIDIEGSAVNIICFEKHMLSKFSKEEVVAIILHEIGHVINPNNSNKDLHEFQADDYAVDRGYGGYIKSSLEKGIDQNYEGFRQDINMRRIARL